MLLQSIKGSPYYKTFGDRAVVWENKLADLDEILNNLNVAQRKWVYLEPYQEQMKFKKPAQTGVSYFPCYPVTTGLLSETFGEGKTEKVSMILS